MASGKLTTQEMERAVFGPLAAAGMQGAQVGVDCAVLRFGKQVVVASSDPVTAGGAQAGRLVVQVCCNDAAAAGAKPIGLLLTCLFPADALIEQIEGLMGQAIAEADKLGVPIIGGHTERTGAVVQPVMVGTVLAKPVNKTISAAGGRPGDHLFVTKTLGLEGTAILTREKALAEDMMAQLSVLPEGLIAACAPGVHALHDITEGGVIGAVCEMAASSGCGAILDRAKLPFAIETTAIAAHYAIDPAALISSGSMLIATSKPNKLQKALTAAGIAVHKVGRLTEAGETLWADGTPLVAPVRDALYDALEQASRES